MKKKEKKEKRYIRRDICEILHRDVKRATPEREDHQEKMHIDEKDARGIGDIRDTSGRDVSPKESSRGVTVRDKNTVSPQVFVPEPLL